MMELKGEWIWGIITLLLLLRMSIEDIKSREISLLLILLLAVLGISRIVFGEIVFDIALIEERAWGIFPGMILLLFAYKTKEKIGKGDGLVLASIGLQMGIEKVSLLLLVALCTCAVFSIGLLLLKRCQLKSTVPFIPFLLLGYIGTALC